MTGDRMLNWDGFHNLRDLGGLPAAGGARTRRGVVFRSAGLAFVTPAGWAQARAAGVRTVLDLRNDAEVAARPWPAPGLDRVRVALDDDADVQFWRYLNDAGLNGTPLYFRPFLAAKPQRCAAAVTALARARPGGVLLHCGAGRDRTGLVSALLLTLAGVAPQVVADDYALSTAGASGYFAALGKPDEGPEVAALLAGRGLSVREAARQALDGFDAATYLAAAGVSAADLAALRERLLGPAARPVSPTDGMR